MNASGPKQPDNLIDVIALTCKVGFFNGLLCTLEVRQANVALQHFTVHGLDEFIDGAQQSQ
ncbi:hypothetical protein D3C72_2433730 [compost metagenome]